MAERATTADVFQDRAGVYDALVDWPHRLTHEAPFFQDLFAEAGVRRVLDVACGTGHHAAMFHSWNLEVEGADISPAMIARCREAFGESETLHWVVRSFDAACDGPGTFDAVICIGNSLALANDCERMADALGHMREALRPGGVCVIGVLNLWHVPEGPSIWHQCRHRRDKGTPHVVLKGMHRVGSHGFIDLIDLKLDAVEEITSRVDTASFLGLEANELRATVSRAGGVGTELFGGFGREPYDRSVSIDLIGVFRSPS